MTYKTVWVSRWLQKNDGPRISHILSELAGWLTATDPAKPWLERLPRTSSGSRKAWRNGSVFFMNSQNLQQRCRVFENSMQMNDHIAQTNLLLLLLCEYLRHRQQIMRWKPVLGEQVFSLVTLYFTKNVNGENPSISLCKFLPKREGMWNELWKSTPLWWECMRSGLVYMQLLLC